MFAVDLPVLWWVSLDFLLVKSCLTYQILTVFHDIDELCQLTPHGLDVCIAFIAIYDDETMMEHVKFWRYDQSSLMVNKNKTTRQEKQHPPNVFCLQTPLTIKQYE